MADDGGRGVDLDRESLRRLCHGDRVPAEERGGGALRGGRLRGGRRGAGQRREGDVPGRFAASLPESWSEAQTMQGTGADVPRARRGVGSTGTWGTALG